MSSKYVGVECYGPKCDRQPTKRGLCDAHYTMLRRDGELRPLRPKSTSEDTIQCRLESYTATVDPNGCRMWVGANYGRDGQKYGSIWYKTKPVKVHRLVYALSTNQSLKDFGPIHHTCGNTLCAAPEHLQEVTDAENSAEMLARYEFMRQIEKLTSENAVLAAENTGLREELAAIAQQRALADV